MPIDRRLQIVYKINMAIIRKTKVGKYAGWAKQNTLTELAKFDPKKLDSKHSWDLMDTVSEKNTTELFTRLNNGDINRSCAENLNRGG